MMNTSHRTILRKLEGQDVKGKHVKGIIEILAETYLGVSDFFIESTYKDATGKENKCYKCTRKGCEFLTHKFTGEKGIKFTARYINRFHQMEEYIKSQQQSAAPEQLPKEAYLLKNSQKTWFQKENWKMKILCEAFDWERRYLYRKILEQLDDIYNIPAIEDSYIKRMGHRPKYPMELVEFFQPMQETATRYLDFMMKETAD